MSRNGTCPCSALGGKCAVKTLMGMNANIDGANMTDEKMLGAASLREAYQCNAHHLVLHSNFVTIDE